MTQSDEKIQAVAERLQAATALWQKQLEFAIKQDRAGWHRIHVQTTSNGQIKEIRRQHEYLE